VGEGGRELPFDVVDEDLQVCFEYFPGAAGTHRERPTGTAMHDNLSNASTTPSKKSHDKYCWSCIGVAREQLLIFTRLFILGFISLVPWTYVTLFLFIYIQKKVKKLPCFFLNVHIFS